MFTTKKNQEAYRRKQCLALKSLAWLSWLCSSRQRSSAGCWKEPRLTERVSEFGKHADRAMGVLLIKCPNTGRQFSTGIHVDAETLARVPQEFTYTHCPYCNSEHLWLPREAELVDAIPSSEWIENQARY
jgi:hypothetical protein